MSSYRVPQPLQPIFEKAEQYVQRLFNDVARKPEDGTIHIGGERYVWIRCESLYLSWFSRMALAFGEEAAREFIYNTAREIGHSDAEAFAARMEAGRALPAGRRPDPLRARRPAANPDIPDFRVCKCNTCEFAEGFGGEHGCSAPRLTRP